jgi:hypothetical protein
MWGINPSFFAAPCDIPTRILHLLEIGDGKARPEYTFQEPENGEWNCHVFDSLESPARILRHYTVQSAGRKLTRLDRDLSLRD